MNETRRTTADAAIDESAVVAFLSDPASYPDRPGSVEVIETHAARVFLAGRRAYKIKKRVTLPFLDFASASAREAALARELTLNKPHAADIYERLDSVRLSSSGQLSFETGDPVEPVLIMRRFAQDDLLARISGRGALQIDTARDLALMVADYHRSVPTVMGLSGAEIMRDTVAQLAEELRQDTPASHKREAEMFASACLSAVDSLASLLDLRARSGLVRRCHGDLHLGNIVLMHGRPVPFDALEFDERLATIDVLYDLAFLIMDLDVRGDRAAANRVLNAYVAAEPAGSEIEGLIALPLFLATRAAVRAMVALARARQLRAYGGDDESVARGLDYLAAANAYLTPPKPSLLAIGGLSGTGKTSLATALASHIGPSPGALLIRTDVERKRSAGVPETQRLPKSHYIEVSSDTIYGRVYAKIARGLAAGHAVIFDGVASKDEERQHLADIARAAGADFHGLWLEAPIDTQIARVTERRGDASDSDEEVVRAQADRGIGSMSWPRIDAGQSRDHTLEQARAILSAHGVLRA